jgi:hypothetical protein
VTVTGKVDLLTDGEISTIAGLRFRGTEVDVLGIANYYGHYGWPSLIAVSG